MGGEGVLMFRLTDFEKRKLAKELREKRLHLTPKEMDGILNSDVLQNVIKKLVESDKNFDK